VRSESKEDARRVDKLTQKAWLGHPHLYVIDNSTDFEGKMNRLIDIVSKIVGLPSNLKRRSAKFLLRCKPDLSKFPSDLDYQGFEVEKVYLQNLTTGPGNHHHQSDDYSFIRRRSSIDIPTGRILGSVYQLTTVRRSIDGETIEQKRIITVREYDAARRTRDRNRHIVLQKRISFLYEKQSFNIHMYEAPIDDLCILHAQVEAEKGDHVLLPPFLDVERLIERTKEDQEKYGAYSISLIKK
jgi:hypothetical protein